MDVITIYAYMNKLPKEAKEKLLKFGWQRNSDNKDYFVKETEHFSLEFVSLEFADQLICSLKRDEQIIRYVDCIPFDFSEGWRAMWSKNIELLEVHFFALKDQTSELLQNGWIRNDMFPETMLQLPNNTDFLYMKRGEDSRDKRIYFEFQDASTTNALDYPQKLKEVGIL